MSNFLPDYQSESDTDENYCENENTVATNSRQKIIWTKEAVFQEKNKIYESIAKENCWSKLTNFIDAKGCKVVRYRCNKVKLRGEQCAAAIRIVFNSQNEEIYLYRSQAEHTHENIGISTRTYFSEEVKAEIKKLFDWDHSVKPAKILNHLITQKLTPPSKIQVNNYLARLRKEKFGPSTIHLGELHQILIDRSKVPDNNNDAFVVDYNVNYDENVFKFFISSKQLLQLAINCTHLHADATYKILWQGFPVHIVGTTDRDRAFHCFGMAICTGETTQDFEFTFNALKTGIAKFFQENYCPNILVSDAAMSIKNAFNNVFSANTDIIIKMCWFHMRKNVVNNASKLVTDKKRRREILDDINYLQIARSEAMFKKMLGLFIIKWETSEKDFINYFRSEWIKNNPNWYEGICANVPSTNNGLESFNRKIKDDCTLRERLPISRFMTLAFSYVERWSNEYIKLQEPKMFATSPTITLQLWTKAYEWAKMNKEIEIISEADNMITYLFPANKIIKLADTVKESEMTTFNDYKKGLVGYMVTLPSNDYFKGICECPQFLKQYMCKHILGLAIRKKIVVPPPAARSNPIGNKRRRGRPAKAKQALIIQ